MVSKLAVQPDETKVALREAKSTSDLSPTMELKGEPKLSHSQSCIKTFSPVPSYLSIDSPVMEDQQWLDRSVTSDSARSYSKNGLEEKAGVCIDYEERSVSRKTPVKETSRHVKFFLGAQDVFNTEGSSQWSDSESDTSEESSVGVRSLSIMRSLTKV